MTFALSCTVTAIARSSLRSEYARYSGKVLNYKPKDAWISSSIAVSLQATARPRRRGLRDAARRRCADAAATSRRRTNTPRTLAGRREPGDGTARALPEARRASAASTSSRGRSRDQRVDRQQQRVARRRRPSPRAPRASPRRRAEPPVAVRRSAARCAPQPERRADVLGQHANVGALAARDVAAIASRRVPFEQLERVRSRRRAARAGSSTPARAYS